VDLRAPSSSSPFWKLWERFTDLNTWIYRRSGGRFGNKMPFTGAPIILLHHVGRKSGQHRVSPLIGLPDGERWVVVASKGGTDKHPAWLHNLRASPETEIEVGRERLPVTARVVGEAERDELWPRLVELYPPYEDYQRYAGERRIQVVSLEPRGGPAADASA
jgi:F420H(2)-dependent quinone reductase